jgi:Zn-dependent protease
MALVALAGPASNVVFAVILAVAAIAAAGILPSFSQYAANGVRLSLYLAIFNLLPVPPLDGSKLLLAAKVPYAVYAELARFGILLLLVALTATSLGRWMSLWSLEGTEQIFQLLHR